MKITIRKRYYTTLEKETVVFDRLKWSVTEKTERWQDTNRPLVGDFNLGTKSFRLSSPVEFHNYVFNFFLFGIDASGQLNGDKIEVAYHLPVFGLLKLVLIYFSFLPLAVDNFLLFFNDDQPKFGLMLIGLLVPVGGIWLINSQLNSLEQKILDMFGV